MQNDLCQREVFKMETIDFDKLKEMLLCWFIVENEDCEGSFNRTILLTHKNGNKYRIEWYKNICYFFFNDDSFIFFTNVVFSDTFPRVGGNTMSMFLYSGKEYYAVINVESIEDLIKRKGY